MKRICLRFAVAAAAVAAMTAIAAMPASAGTVLCKGLVTTCPQEQIKPAGSFLVTANPGWHGEYETKGLKVESGIMRLHCNEELMSVKTSLRNGNPLPGTLSSSVDASECKQVWLPKTTCSSVTMNSAPTSLEATEEAKVAQIGSEAEPLSVSFECDFNGEVEETCTFEATGPVAMTLGEESASIEGAPLVRTAGESWVCDYFAENEPELTVENIQDGTSRVSQATETVLCGETEVEADPCSNSEILPAGATLLTGAYNDYLHGLVIRQDGGGKSHECGNFGLGFDTTEDAGQPLEAEGSYGSVIGNSCTAFRFGERSCSSATVNTPDATIEATGGGDAIIEVGTAEQPLVVSFTCELGSEALDVCTYEATGSVTMEVDGQERIVSVDDAPLKRVKGSFLTCGPETGMVLDMTAGYNYPHVEITSI